jgi:hypothetical protein
MAHGDAWERKWRGYWRMEWVASTLHTTSEHGVSSITTADAHTSAASSRLNWRPHRFKWTHPFRRKTKSGFCACAITFQTQSTTKCVVTNWHKLSQLLFLSLETRDQGGQFPTHWIYRCSTDVVYVFTRNLLSGHLNARSGGESMESINKRRHKCYSRPGRSVGASARIEASCANRSLFVYWLNCSGSSGSPEADLNDSLYTSVLRAVCTATLHINTVS